ncbi:hypothetical protein LCGC14_1226770 [marine sediment metagenome]|uniref:Zinc ribbon domain-containing protein n=1 Tax=marine sediment metagenome TaxID=412755 RepID=A0A0F9NRX4_9ZZZZ
MTFICTECGMKYLDNIEGILNKVSSGSKEFTSHCFGCNNYTLFKLKEMEEKVINR